MTERHRIRSGERDLCKSGGRYDTAKHERERERERGWRTLLVWLLVLG